MPPAATCSSSARAAGPSISTSTKVFYKAPSDAQATTLLSMGNVDARRLRCILVGTKHACVATLFSSGEGRAFLFDPATPRATPAVIVLTAAAGTLGVAQALLPNGHVARRHGQLHGQLADGGGAVGRPGDDPFARRHSGTDRLHGAGARGARSPTAKA